MEKSPDAFRTISEVADELDLPQHVLRFWETRFQQIKPMKRGGGRRYYRPEDVDLLKGIRHLLYDHGYTIKGVQKLLKANGNKFVAAIASGDLATVEALAASSNEEPAPPKAGVAEEDQIVGRP
ncbi:MerR family transcriptional regulator, partial [Sinorhizobium meliloti]